MLQDRTLTCSLQCKNGYTIRRDTACHVRERMFDNGRVSANCNANTVPSQTLNSMPLGGSPAATSCLGEHPLLDVNAQHTQALTLFVPVRPSPVYAGTLWVWVAEGRVRANPHQLSLVGIHLSMSAP